EESFGDALDRLERAGRLDCGRAIGHPRAMRTPGGETRVGPLSNGFHPRLGRRWTPADAARPRSRGRSLPGEGRWMKRLLVIAISIAVSALAEAKPRVKILATGGTIAGAQPKPGEVGYKSGAYDVGVLIKAVPGLDGIASVSGEQIASIGS